MNRSKLKHVWMVEDAPAVNGIASKTYWTKIGIATENEDGSLTLTLAAIPVTGRMIIRDAMPATVGQLKRGVA